MNTRPGILSVSVTILVLCFVGTASATNWSVDGSGGANFTRIQEAINNASMGDTIIVNSGVYYENVVVDKSVMLKGIDHPVVDVRRSGSAIRLTADGITLVGFTATNAGNSWQDKDAGIKVISSNNTITGNNVCNNNRGGIGLFDSCDNNITGNNVCNNRGGIGLSDSCSNTITGNNVCNNNGGGIGLSDSCDNNITGNNVCNNNWDGIRLDNSCNNRIKGNNASNNNWEGIYLYSSSSSNNITGNNVCNNGDGIRLYSSSNKNTITGNVFVNDGLSVHDSYQNTVEDNTVNGKPLVYLEDVSDYKVEDAGQVILVNCSNISVENLDLSYTCVGIELWETGNSIISNNTVCNNEEGIYLYSSSNNNKITGNNASNNNGGGIRLSDSSNNTITGNNASNNNDDGIRLDNSSNNNITGNNVCNNNAKGICLHYSSNCNTITGNNVNNNHWDGIIVHDSCNNSIAGNNVCNNRKGIYIYDSCNNTIYFNNFINNTDNVYFYTSTTIWNSPFEITYTYNGSTYESYLGNYWGNYGGTDAEGDGIRDTHYSIDTEKDESDDYPLMKPFENYTLTTSAPA